MIAYITEFKNSKLANQSIEFDYCGLGRLLKFCISSCVIMISLFNITKQAWVTLIYQ